MLITQLNPTGPEPPLDYMIKYTEGAIAKQGATIERLTAEGHAVTDASKRLTDMIVNLATLKHKKRNGG